MNTNDRFYGDFFINQWVPGVVFDMVVGAYKVTWTGTTYTANQEVLYSPGATSVLPQRNGTNFVLNVFSTGTRTAVRVTAKLNGIASVFM